jgi:hypothetical protein
MPIFSRKPEISSQVIALLGMHRSGTSCLAGSLQLKGLFLGEVHEWNEHNRKGNRENETIATLNEDVLVYNGGSWHQPPATMKWQRKHSKRRDEIVREFAATGQQCWGFKDTRVTFTLPFWQDVAPQMQMVGTFRHPLLVAQSLNKRDNMPVDYALDVWCAYNRRMLERYTQQPFPIISFDLNSADYLAGIDRIVEHLNLPEPNGKQFLDRDLKTVQPELSMTLMTAEIGQTYQRLQDAYQASIIKSTA